MKVVQILGMAANVAATPNIGAERWCCGNPRSYRIKFPEVIKHDNWTRWFNMHTRRHMDLTYPGADDAKVPTGLAWYRQQSKPIYLQEVQPDIPASIKFPRAAIQTHFSLDGTPFRYFTCSVTWLIAFAIMEGFERIELWGFALKRDQQYDFERPCFFYWVERARQSGIDVFLPDGIEISEPGDPTTYIGPLYGYEPHNEKYAKTF